MRIADYLKETEPDNTSVKRKLYYILLKEKRWTAMRAIVNLKQALKR